MDLLSNKAIITSAPAQNREGFEGAIERAMPLLASRQLNLLAASQEHVDLWNNVGSKIDKLYTTGAQHDESRAEYGQRILYERYQFLESLQLLEVNDTTLIVTDDSPEMTIWIQQKLKEMASNGMIYTDSRNMYVCDGCEKTIGIVTGRITTRLGCQTCGESSFHEEQRDALFMDVDTTLPNIVLPRKSRHIASHSAHVPSSVAIERNRSYGTSLDCMDSEYVLDPKIALSMMYGYVADIKANSRFVVVQGSGTLYNTAPYTQTISPELEMKYVLIPNIPTGMDQADVMRLGVSFVKKYLPLFLVDRTSDVSVEQIQELYREHANARAYMDKMRDIPVADEESDISVAADVAVGMVHDIQKTMDGGRVRDGVMMTRNKLIKHMGSKGLFAQNVSDTLSIDLIKKKVATIYGD